jgi:hypothetical protein
MPNAATLRRPPDLLKKTIPYPWGKCARMRASAGGFRADSRGAGAESEGEVTKTGPHPTGRQWTDAEDAQLLALLESKMDRIVIARRLKRTVLAIGQRNSVLKKRRLVELGLKAKGK